MTLRRSLGVVAAVAAAWAGLAARRRAAEAGCPFSGGLRQLARDWSPAAVHRRARLALLDGSRAAAARDRAARQQLAMAGAASA